MDVVKLPTLDKFLLGLYGRNAFVSEPGFEELYVRRSRRYINGKLYMSVLDIARVTAAVPGQGTFKALIERLQRSHPAMSIYVESVQTEKFCEGLLRLGFEQVGTEPCFFLPALEEVPPCAA